jgi:hypothetical protein
MELKINYLPEKYENILLPLITINPKLVLGGSLALHILDIMDYDFNNRKPDLDFSLLEPLTEEELIIIKDFFNLDFIIRRNDYETEIEEVDGNLKHKFKKNKSVSHFLTKDIIQLFKPNLITHINGSNLESDGSEHWDKEYIIDFFNKTYLPNKELIKIPYKDFELRLTHPSYILSHKSKYAYDNRVGKQYKHFQDLQKINWKKYFTIIKKFQYKWVPTSNDPKSKKNKISHMEYHKDQLLDTIDMPF